MFGLGERSTKRRRDESGHPIGTVVSVKTITLPSGSRMPGDDPTYDLVGYICDYGEKNGLGLGLHPTIPVAAGAYAVGDAIDVRRAPSPKATIQVKMANMCIPLPPGTDPGRFATNSAFRDIMGKNGLM